MDVLHFRKSHSSLMAENDVLSWIARRDLRFARERDIPHSTKSMGEHNADLAV